MPFDIVQTKDRQLVSYLVVPFDTNEIREIFSDYLFRRVKPKPSDLPQARVKIMIVDDEKSMREVLKMFLKRVLPHYQLVVASTGDEALRLFCPEEFALVITDQYMPGVRGTDLTMRLLEMDPAQRIIMITAYYSPELAKEFLAKGGFYFQVKPFGLPEISKTLRWALDWGDSVWFREKIGILCDKPDDFLWLLQQASDTLASVVLQVGDPHDSAHILLRHKAKLIVMDFVENLQPGSDVINLLSIVNIQLGCIERLSRFVGQVQSKDVENYLKRLAGDLGRANPKVKFSMSCTFGADHVKRVPFGTVLILVICELIDNAISAMERCGTVEVTVTLLATSATLHVTVQDTGPGIDPKIAKQVFEPGVSTKGQGRGMGLSLVRDAVYSLGGKIDFECDKGTRFDIMIPVK